MNSKLNSLSQLMQGLQESELATRLGVDPETLARKREDEDFSSWTQSQDPEGVSWRFQEKSRRYLANLGFSSV